MNRILGAGCLMVLLAVGAAGQDWERFELYNGCRPMDVVVESLNDAAAEVGLTQERLQAAVESRLRSARLYTEDVFEADFAYFYVNVHIVGPAYSRRVQYKKWVTDEYGNDSNAVTWDTASTGTHGGDGGFIVQGLSEDMDVFIADYLRVNEESCR